MTMRAFLSAALTVWLGATGLATAQDASRAPVVVELYTSQGCNSCPPADALLASLTERSDVIPLALHVDYWDYIGWKDIFADPKYTERQRAYARVAGARTIYTPQMIVSGMDHLVGARPAELTALIKHYAAMPKKAALRISRDGTAILISADPLAEMPGGTVVQLVRYRPRQTVSIRAGENAGREIAYHNIVTEWRRIGNWDGRSVLSMRVEAPAGDPAVVILQEPGPGKIVAAAKLK